MCRDVISRLRREGQSRNLYVACEIVGEFLTTPSSPDCSHLPEYVPSPDSGIPAACLDPSSWELELGTSKAGLRLAEESRWVSRIF